MTSKKRGMQPRIGDRFLYTGDYEPVYGTLCFYDGRGGEDERGKWYGFTVLWCPNFRYASTHEPNRFGDTLDSMTFLYRPKK
jgi:hypothetical protein